MLIILGGKPGVGKTSLARMAAREFGWMLVRVDTIEAVLLNGRPRDLGPAGYEIGQAVATENLRLGRTVIADSVNPIDHTRCGWRDAAVRADAPFLEVLVTCSDHEEHRRRVERRSSGPDAPFPPSWPEVQTRVVEPWPDAAPLETSRIDPLEAARALARLVARV